MSKFTAGAKKPREMHVVAKVNVNAQTVTTHEGGINYVLNPLLQLRFILASSIFGEPNFYETAQEATKRTVAAIDAALSYDFHGTLMLAAELRQLAWMRTNPNIILARAALHEGRVAYTTKHPGMFRTLEESVALRPDDLTTQVEYILGLQGKNKFPGVLKRAVAHRLAQFSTYHMAKYQNRGIGLLDVVRITHASSDAIAQLVKNGKIEVADNERTWKTLKSEGKTWETILTSGITMSHQDYLYNLRGMSKEVSRERLKTVLDTFVKGVARSKVFPYKYYVAYEAVKRESYFANQAMVLDALELALREACKNMKKLQGTTAILADNSGSMHTSMQVDNQSMMYSQLANISAVLAAARSDHAILVPFATNFQEMPFSTTQGLIAQVQEVERVGSRQGGGTVMVQYFNHILQKKVHLDNIMIFSDLQVMPAHRSTWSLYGRSDEVSNVHKVVETYRKTVNPRLNVFVNQVAGFDNSVLPDTNTPRSINMAGWTGNEVDFMIEIAELWNQAEK